MGPVWRIRKQLGIHVLHERVVWNWRRSHDSEHRGFARHHIPTWKEAKSWFCTIWSYGACRCGGWFSGFCSYRPADRVEILVLHAVRMHSWGMEVLSADVLPSSGLLGLVVYGTAIISVPPDKPVDPNGSVDWVGAYLGVGGLILFNFVWK